MKQQQTHRASRPHQKQQPQSTRTTQRAQLPRTQTPEQLKASMTLRAVASQLYNHLRAMDRPPADNIEIPISKLKEQQPGVYVAAVTFTVEYVGEKKHTVKIAFEVDENNRIKFNTCAYVK